MSSLMRRVEQRRDEPLLDAVKFRLAMRQLVGGVTVVAAGDGEERSGMTATSVVPVSVDPPTVLVCVNRASSFYPVLQRCAEFSVNLLSAEQQHIAERFTGAGGAKGAERYMPADWTTADSGVPLLKDALAAVDCEMERLIDYHTHAIVIGTVRSIRLGSRRDALAYWQGEYAHVTRLSRE